MNLNFDPISLFSGISLAIIGGWTASFIAFRKDERSVQLEQITQERTRWRDNMRALSEEIAANYATVANERDPVKIASMRARLATSISPQDPHDIEILAHYDRLFASKPDDLRIFIRRISLLLKHDWERVKWECMPLYKKPFFYFTQKQRAWRRECYRDING